jgi:hypothetical protein
MWFLADDGLLDSEELLSIPGRYQNAALGVWTKIGIWMAKHGRHFIPFAAVRKIGGTQLLCDCLADAGLLEWGVQNGSKGLLYTGQGCRVKAPDDVQAARDATAERVRKHRAKKQNGVDVGGRVGVTPLPVTGSEALPVTAAPGLVSNESSFSNLPTSKAELLPKSGTALAPMAQANELVQAALAGLSYVGSKERSALREKVLECLGDGAPEDAIAEALGQWVRTSDVYAGHLPHMVTQIMKARAGPLRARDGGQGTLSAVDEKTLGWLEKGRE